MTSPTLPAGVPPGGSSLDPRSPQRIREAAEQFEALLIGQLLRSLRESSTGWLGTGEDAAGEQALGLAEQQFAQALTAQGGLGLARLIASQLAAPQPDEGGGPPPAS